MEGALRNYVQTGAPAAAPAPQTPQAPQASSLQDGDYVTGADLNRMAPRVIDQYVQPQLQQVVEQTANLALETVKREFAAEFQRFGPSIYANLAQLPDKRGWTVDNLRKLVKYSLIDHQDEIVRDRAARLVAEMPGTLRSTGAALPAGTPNQPDLSTKSERLPAEYRARLEKTGVTESVMDEFCRANDMTREDFIKMIEKQAITEAPRR